MMESTKHAADDGNGRRLPEKAWRELEEIQAQLEFLAAVFEGTRPACQAFRERLEDPRLLALCLRAVGSQVARVRRHGPPPGH